ncbi:hypothetical protein GLAREA_06548 [Glarea lozoyensis ATCC 20868]|uniref:Uncharacterized protein n=1 Tax=Glarea lozoyensis (strain ATCC 20868 / MF5171) TaxID=1116229 RepID=S3D6W6_GLAL2|nr:uncharacterized protein GLAREA_06548 [Glarea lozoyensis ATCC 20868]EPE33535.1 hypothetical protein GLAREA_06548 [Glarea lozoyensis ATCC 20868]
MTDQRPIQTPQDATESQNQASHPASTRLSQSVPGWENMDDMDMMFDSQEMSPPANQEYVERIKRAQDDATRMLNQAEEFLASPGPECSPGLQSLDNYPQLFIRLLNGLADIHRASMSAHMEYKAKMQKMKVEEDNAQLKVSLERLNKEKEELDRRVEELNTRESGHKEAAELREKDLGIKEAQLNERERCLDASWTQTSAQIVEDLKRKSDELDASFKKKSSQLQEKIKKKEERLDDAFAKRAKELEEKQGKDSLVAQNMEKVLQSLSSLQLDTEASNKRQAQNEERQAQHKENIKKRELTIAEKDAIIKAKDVTLAEKDSVIAQKDSIIFPKDAAIVENNKNKDSAIASKDVIVLEKDKALAEKDSIIAQKDAAIAQTNKEKDSATVSKDKPLAEKDSIIAQKDIVIAETNKERGSAITSKDAIISDKDKALAEKDSTIKGKDSVIQAKDEMIVNLQQEVHNGKLKGEEYNEARRLLEAAILDRHEIKRQLERAEPFESQCRKLSQQISILKEQLLKAQLDVEAEIKRAEAKDARFETAK